jgi:hypothetical protein
VPVESLRIQVAQEYAEALGRAAYIFSYLEWSVVWCIDRMEPNYIQTVSRKTAGQIAKDLLRISEGLPLGCLRETIVPLAEQFHFLVQERNSLLHSNPGSALDGSQLLFRDGHAWKQGDIEALSDRFANLAIRTNELLHGELSL